MRSFKVQHRYVDATHVGRWETHSAEVGGDDINAEESLLGRMELVIGRSWGRPMTARNGGWQTEREGFSLVNIRCNEDVTTFDVYTRGRDTVAYNFCITGDLNPHGPW